MRNAFFNERTDENSDKWEQAVKREVPIYSRNDVRTEFERDYTRILHSQAYRRLKHKTQVFFAPHNDHICTRMEHVMHVASVASTEVGVAVSASSAKHSEKEEIIVNIISEKTNNFENFLIIFILLK